MDQENSIKLTFIDKSFKQPPICLLMNSHLFFQPEVGQTNGTLPLLTMAGSGGTVTLQHQQTVQMMPSQHSAQNVPTMPVSNFCF